MVEREVKIGDYQVNVTPWGFLTMMKNKRKFIELISKVAPDVVELIEGGGDDIEIEEIIPIIASIVEAFDEETLMWFIKTILSQTHVNGMDMSDDGSADLMLTANSSLFYKICLHVLKVNFGDFLEMLQTRSDSVATKG